MPKSTFPSLSFQIIDRSKIALVSGIWRGHQCTRICTILSSLLCNLHTPASWALLLSSRANRVQAGTEKARAKLKEINYARLDGQTLYFGCAWLESNDNSFGCKFEDIQFVTSCRAKYKCNSCTHNKNIISYQ